MVNLFVPRKATAPFFPSCTGSHHKATPRIHAAAVPHSLRAQQKPVAAASSDTAATGKNQAFAGLWTYVYNCRIPAAYSRWGPKAHLGGSASAKHSF